ncbi:hypothetical protein BCR33DRAFT_846846 [Rhizoclosmatium globosum]|uniref:Small EDRK-rich factor-like N-terminal domain-containing protein n=1 Tax=Rhizoclosmatium globosum TaxID=329046 RepID=A0A1Y2CTV4_9FUNG|nr:hypothetical protein BCR33DRAFT_846846 [Rhizoclosmatium globosum]|eukprot:ORY50326.1 hypothetical protein BCR33DRAFT_846846 [Rhizoclosmatium globosum]
MTRGNQRELARAKNQKKAAAAGGGRQDEMKDMTPQQRHEYDAAQLKAKLAAKAAAKAAAEANGGAPPAPAKGKK